MAYDVEMLRDFIEHLKWSLRVDHFEFTAGPEALNQELMEQVERFGRKRGVPRLLSLYLLRQDRPELTDDQMKKAIGKFAAGMAERREEQLRHLEALKECLDEACYHAAGKVMEIVVPGSKILNGSWFTDGESGSASS
jgi:hypothetical protein